ncbi:ATP-binding protein [Alkalimonas amylolytica]|uniref:Adenylate kinase n=1 Tax=Alkalimonas amylolytica TaxID=152573 RepID=A0A1H4DX41_ALKAM|nr:ATP-binding protein [Alkalimonas amylolytica]SEA76772.1 adenylate kinase [Alkalimonas amylolytica]
MKREVIFIGGIHGAGKSTLCSKLVSNLQIPHYSASQLIKNANEGLFKKDKTVTDVSKNQDVLLSAIDEFVSEPCFLLDGHFALFDSDHNVQLVPAATFASMGLTAICVVTCDVNVVLERIATRDGIRHDKSAYETLNHSEIAHAKVIAERLNIPLFLQNTNNDVRELTKFISEHLE